MENFNFKQAVLDVISRHTRIASPEQDWVAVEKIEELFIEVIKRNVKVFKEHVDVENFVTRIISDISQTPHD